MDILWSILIVSLLTVIYTVTGGLKAVVITESIQTVLLLIGAAAVTIFGMVALHDKGITSLDALREAAKPGQMSMIHTEGEFAWWIMLLGYPVMGIWYWCSDQTIVQRVLGARSERDAQLGPIFAGFIKVLPVFLMVLPGVIGYVLFADMIGDNPDATLITLDSTAAADGIAGAGRRWPARSIDEYGSRRAEFHIDVSEHRHHQTHSPPNRRPHVSPDRSGDGHRGDALAPLPGRLRARGSAVSSKASTP